MTTRRHLMASCCLLVVVAASCTSMIDRRDEIEANRARTAPIIEAIAAFERDHGAVPEKLDELVPAYLPELPRTIGGQGFVYFLEPVEGYNLCFDLVSTRNLGCCYSTGFPQWECSWECE